MAQRVLRSIWAEEEEGVLQSSGVASTGSLVPWVVGRWRLDKTALRFKANAVGRDLNIPLTSIRRIEQSRRKFLVVSKPVLVITHFPPRASRAARVWLLVGDLDLWRESLSLRTPRKAPVSTVAAASRGLLVTKALESVSGSVGQVLDVLSAGPATSATLAGVLELDQASALVLPDVLRRTLAGVEAALGQPVVRYERHRFDPATGKVQSMCWWLDGLVKGIWLTLRTPYEVHIDEVEAVAITSVPTRINSTSITVKIEDEGRGLLLTGSEDYCRYIGLPVAVETIVEVQMRQHGTVAVRAAIRADGNDDASPNS